jgi:hypothetical protein
MNKNGDLMKNVLSLIIAVFGVALIFFAGYQLYSSAGSQAEDNARDMLGAFEKKIELIPNNGKLIVLGRELKGWFMIGWAAGENTKPGMCGVDSCLCVCEGEIRDSNSKLPGALACQENGFCREFESDSVQVLEVYATAPILIKKDFINFDSNEPREFQIAKTSDGDIIVSTPRKENS